MDMQYAVHVCLRTYEKENGNTSLNLFLWVCKSSTVNIRIMKTGVDKRDGISDRKCFVESTCYIILGFSRLKTSFLRFEGAFGQAVLYQLLYVSSYLHLCLTLCSFFSFYFSFTIFLCLF